jgi:monovalent cation/hydrogen antiporter
MIVFELVLGLLLAGVCLALLAPRIGVPWPALLALAGVVLALIPGVPEVTLDPRLALGLFVAPVLLDAAYDASPRDLRQNWAAVTGLVLVAVGLTVAGVAATAHWLNPAMPWAAAIALGAIVAPPDAAAATSVLRQVRLPHRMLVILEGESLLNEASALLIYRLAVGAAAGGVTLYTGPMIALSAAGGVLLGMVLARGFLAISSRIEEGPAAVLLQFLGTFGVWLLADRLALSPVLTVVAFAVTLARVAPGRMSARHRRASYAVWEVVVFVLNVLAFILVGLQLRGILTRLHGLPGRYATFGLAVLAACILIRFAWVMTHNTALRWTRRRALARGAEALTPPTIQGGLVISWCGMRGIVTLAAALALPEQFPERDLIVFTAFCVVLGTLVLQGITLRPFLARLTLQQDDSVADEVGMARAEAARAALEALGDDRASDIGRFVAKEYEARLRSDAQAETKLAAVAALRRRALGAERQRLAALLREGRIGDDAFHLVEEELDWAEANEREH